MRAVLIYWVIGCIIAGVAGGSRQRECGSTFEIWQLATVAAGWPGLVAFGFTAYGFNPPASNCESR